MDWIKSLNTNPGAVVGIGLSVATFAVTLRQAAIAEKQANISNRQLKIEEERELYIPRIDVVIKQGFFTTASRVTVPNRSIDGDTQRANEMLACLDKIKRTFSSINKIFIALSYTPINYEFEVTENFEEKFNRFIDDMSQTLEACSQFQIRVSNTNNKPIFVYPKESDLELDALGISNSINFTTKEKFIIQPGGSGDFSFSAEDFSGLNEIKIPIVYGHTLSSKHVLFVDIKLDTFNLVDDFDKSRIIIRGIKMLDLNLKPYE